MPKSKEVEDERFSQIKWHPKFRRVPRQIRKVKIDKRFESMFKDPNFKLKNAVDKRGRPLGHSSTEDLRRYYDISSAESGSGDEEEDCHSVEEKVPIIDKKSANSRSKATKADSEDDEESNGEDSGEAESSSEEKDEEEEEAIKIDLARGEGNISSSDDSSSDWEFQEDEDEPLHDWEDVDTNQAPTIENATSRLAICNMDWERITAKDLLILLNSFKPTSGIIRYVKIYPSDFGLQRMSEEQKHGPVELRESKTESDDEDDDGAQRSFLDKAQEERQQKILLEKLRQYEFNRLKYYYAVAECDSIETAEFVYSNCGGMEYEASGTRLDLRFIPDDMEFDQRDPKDQATSVGDLSSYQPNVFVNKSLQQSRPVLTWEEERNAKRVEITKKAFENLEDWDRLELNGVLASPSSSEASDQEEGPETNEQDESGVEENSAMSNGEEKEVGRAKATKSYKTISLSSLASSDDHGHRKDEEDDVEMEIKWDANIEENLEKEKSNRDSDKKKTQWEKYLEKRKEKKRQRKEELRQKRLAVKRQRRGYDEDDDDFPSDFEDGTTSKSKKRRKHAQQQPEEAEDLEQKKQQEAELELLLADSDDETKRRHFSLKKLLKSDKKKDKTATRGSKADSDQEDFTINMGDPRFKAVFDSHLFNIDPSDPAFKKTPGMKKLVEEKFKSKSTGGTGKKEVNPEYRKKGDPELSLLAKKLKAKTDLLRREKERKSSKKV